MVQVSGTHILKIAETLFIRTDETWKPIAGISVPVCHMCSKIVDWKYLMQLKCFALFLLLSNTG